MCARCGCNECQQTFANSSTCDQNSPSNRTFANIKQTKHNCTQPHRHNPSPLHRRPPTRIPLNSDQAGKSATYTLNQNRIVNDERAATKALNSKPLAAA